jgi:hypothetical protein
MFAVLVAAEGFKAGDRAAAPKTEAAAPAPSSEPESKAIDDAAATDKSGCRMGAKVVDRQGRRGVITDIQNGMCWSSWTRAAQNPIWPGC